MDKRRIDKYLKSASQVLLDTGIAKGGRVKSNYRSQISSFGASIAQGSILSAVAVYCGKKGASVPTERLMAAIYLLKNYHENNIEELKKNDAKTNALLLFEYVKAGYPEDSYVIKEEIMEYAIALKVAMSLYELE